MNAGWGLDAQFWVVAVCVGLAFGYTVWAAVRKVQRSQSGGSACGGCTGDACGSGGSGGSGCASRATPSAPGTPGSPSTAGTPGAAQSSAPGQGAAAVQAQPLRWHPPAKRAEATPSPARSETN